MPDITMCSDEKCPHRMKCYRYRAIPNGDRQSWFTESPRVFKTCLHFSQIYTGNPHLIPESELK
jgi:hypothetical protein